MYDYFQQVAHCIRDDMTLVALDAFEAIETPLPRQRSRFHALAVKGSRSRMGFSPSLLALQETYCRVDAPLRPLLHPPVIVVHALPLRKLARQITPLAAGLH